MIWKKPARPLASTARWVKDDLDLVMRVALIPVAQVRAQGLDVRVARFAPSSNVSYAMFTGGGMVWAEAAMKRGEFAVPMAPEGATPDLSGLSCRFEEIPAVRGLILSVLVVPVAGADPMAFRKVIEDVIAMAEGSPDAGRPVPAGGPPLKWPPAGFDFEARAWRKGTLLKRRMQVLGTTLVAYLIMRFGISVGGFVPKTYVQQLVENSDFRKYDDGLRMILDCTPQLERALEQRLVAAASAGTIRYGLHRQMSAMMTCFTPSALRSDHVHFIDGAQGGLRVGGDGAEGHACPIRHASYQKACLIKYACLTRRPKRLSIGQRESRFRRRRKRRDNLRPSTTPVQRPKHC